MSVAGTSRRSARAILQVDDKLEFGRLQSAGLAPLRSLTVVGADLTIHVRTIGCVALRGILTVPGGQRP